MRTLIIYICFTKLIHIFQLGRHLLLNYYTYNIIIISIHTMELEKNRVSSSSSSTVLVLETGTGILDFFK